MPYRTIVYDRVGPVARISLNRPDKLNAFNQALLGELDVALEEARADDAARVVVIRGLGRAFSVGFDIGPEARQLAPKTITEDRDRLQQNMERWLRLWDFPKPVIAQVHGYCLAGATQMVICCDLTVVADDARIGFPAIPLGGGYIAQMWTWLVGPKKAKELCFTPGSWIDGREAVQWGFANRSVPADRLEDETLRMAERIARIPAQVLRIKKLSINRVLDVQGFRTAIMFGCEWDALMHWDESVQELDEIIKREGLAAAIEQFTGEPRSGSS